jgi:integrase
MLRSATGRSVGACLTTIYVCGLRLQEGAHLQVADVDSGRGLLHMHRKGRRDRYVPVPGDALTMLREHWRTHRSPQWLFPAPVRQGTRYFVPPALARSRARACRRRSCGRCGRAGCTSERTCTHCDIPTPPISWKTA